MPPPRTNSPSVGLADRALRVSESRYRRLFETARDGILLLNAETAQIDDVNPYLIEVLGYTHADFVGKKLWDLGLFADIALSKNMFAKVRSTGYVRYDYLPLKTKTGVEIAFEFISNSYDYEGIKVIQCNIRNITDRVAADAQAERRIRLYAALSQCNHTIVHCKTEEELLPEICRIAVELGGVKMAWVGMVDSETSSVRPAASWGDTTDYLNGIEISIHDDTPLGRGPIGRVIRENRPVWLQDFMHDPGMAPWQERMARSGFATSAAIPLGSGDNVIGVFIVYSGDSAFFDEPARDLLTQLAMDISFALDGFARDLRRKQAEDALQKSEHEFHTLAEAVPQIVWITSADGSNIYFNRRWVEYTGLSIEDSRGDGWVKQIHPDERDPVRNAWRQANGAIDSYSVENRLRAADGGYRWFLVRAAPLRDEAGIVIKWFGTCTDVHDLKTAEIKIRRLNRVYAVLSSISDLIVHVRDRNELFNETCRIAVEVGGFHLSVLCLADQSAIKFRLVAFAGSDKGLLSLMTNTFSSAGEAPRTLSHPLILLPQWRLEKTEMWQRPQRISP
jgi:PAS domain S-box-containing protein